MVPSGFSATLISVRGFYFSVFPVKDWTLTSAPIHN